MSLWRRRSRAPSSPEARELDALRRRIAAVLQIVSDLYGREKLVLRAGKLEALDLIESADIGQQILGLQRILNEDPTLEEPPAPDDWADALDAVEDAVADLLARRDVEDRLEQRVAVKMQERHDEYMRDLKLQVLKEETGPDNAQTLKKLADLERLEKRALAHSILATMRPTRVDEVVGQDQAKRALFAKIASPFPQHVIVYGPPGVGKTTLARLALEHAKTLGYTPFDQDARFVEVDGTTLRWDPREVTNPLLGSVHDPIYQGAKRDMADMSIPEPKPGLVTEAHGGILFIDEIGEMDPVLQNKLLKVLEEKRVRFESSYYDPDDPNVPKYVKKLFDEGAPADFILIGATTRDPAEINPALRSRAAEIFFDPLSRSEIEAIVMQAGERLGAELVDGVCALISEYTMEGRKATGLLADAYSLALYDHQHAQASSGERRSADESDERVTSVPVGVRVTPAHVHEAVRTGRLVPSVPVRASQERQVGRIFGLGVSRFLGTLIEIEAVAFPAREAGKGSLRFNETAGSMAKDSFFNAASVVRRLTGESLSDWDVHINIVGGGKIDGPSAGAAVVLALVSAILERPARQDVAITGEISIQGRIKPVGGVYEKVFGAKQAGVESVILPAQNRREVAATGLGIHLLPVNTIDEALRIVLYDEEPVGEWASASFDRPQTKSALNAPPRTVHRSSAHERSGQC